MNFQGKAILVYLEEDNIARAYFRVQPLMTQDGPLGSMVADYPDDGYLRIVPDKNEQHTFKERMRTLSGLCLVDLRYFPMDSTKIRTNKNYSPARGETNQYIVYSDAVRALPEDLVYQVVAEGDLRNAVTPQVYIRNGANIQGPFRASDGQSVGDTVQLPPDSTEIHTLNVNGQSILFYWPKAPETAAAPEEKSEPLPQAEIVSQQAIQSEAEPPKALDPEPVHQQNAFEQIQSLNEQLSENANRLRAPAAPAANDFALEQPAKPLVGTKLYQTPQRQLAPRRAHNPLMEAVENQRYQNRLETTRYEAPGATIPQNTELKEVHNPADALKRALQGMSHSPEDQRQAADVILAQSGMRVMLSKVLSRETNDLTLAAMHTQLQELEAERLMTLMQLDDAKKNLAKAHEDALEQLSLAEQKKLDQLHIAQQNAQNALNQLNKEIEPLEQKRQEAAAVLEAARTLQDEDAAVFCPPVGGTADKAELINRVESCLKAAGFLVEEGDAEALLTAYALSENEITFYADAPTDACLAAQAFSAALGVKSQNQGDIVDAVILSGGNAPVFFLGSLEKAHPLLTCCLCEDQQDAEISAPSFPCVSLIQDQDALPTSLPSYPPVAKECVVRSMLKESELSAETKAVIAALRRAMADKRALPLKAVSQMSRFIACTQNSFKGGVAEALDRAACLYAVPFMRGLGGLTDEIKPVLSAMSRALKQLNV